MAGYDWCDAAVPDRSDRDSLEKSSRISFLRVSNYESGVFLWSFLCEQTHLFRENPAFNVKDDLSRKIGPFAYANLYYLPIKGRLEFVRYRICPRNGKGVCTDCALMLIISNCPPVKGVLNSRSVMVFVCRIIKAFQLIYKVLLMISNCLRIKGRLKINSFLVVVCILARCFIGFPNCCSLFETVCRSRECQCFISLHNLAAHSLQ
jgi:hypothetical protein